MPELKDLYRHIAAIVDALKSGGFTAHISNDPAGYKACVAKLDGYTLTSPLDPAFVDIADQFLWLEIRDSHKRPACVEVGRYLWAPRLSGGLNRLLLSRRFFGTKQRVLPVLSKPPAINLAGRLGYLGGGFVAPLYREHGLMSLAAQLTMAHLLRCFSVDHVFGLVRAHHVARSLRTKGYGFTSATMVHSAHWADAAAPETLFMVHADRAALVERLCGPTDYALVPQPAVTAPLKPEGLELQLVVSHPMG